MQSKKANSSRLVRSNLRNRLVFLDSLLIPPSLALTVFDCHIWRPYWYSLFGLDFSTWVGTDYFGLSIILPYLILNAHANALVLLRIPAGLMLACFATLALLLFYVLRLIAIIKVYPPGYLEDVGHSTLLTDPAFVEYTVRCLYNLGAGLTWLYFFKQAKNQIIKSPE